MTPRERLEYLESVVLARVEAEERPFDMSVWVDDRFNPYDCGTSACAGGWGARDPMLRAEGLGVNKHGWITYGLELDFAALRLFFNLDGEAVEWIFNEFSYQEEEGMANMEPPAPIPVATVRARIREYLAANPAP